MNKHTDQIGKVVFDCILQQFAILLDTSGDIYTLEYVDNQKRERKESEVEFKPVRFVLVVG